MGKLLVTRRQLLGNLAVLGGAAAGAGLLFAEPDWLRRLVGFQSERAFAQSLEQLIESAPRARYWVSTATPNVACSTCHSATEIKGATAHPHEQIEIMCQLCAQGCRIGEGERGRCRARMNVKGELRSLVYGRPVIVHIDPIEKKPFYHFLPGSKAYSLSTAGCPLHCKFCQNWEVSQANPEDVGGPFVSPAQIVGRASNSHSPVIAFTYNEATVFTEYFTDIARQARPKGLRSVLVSCGFMTEAPLTEMCQVLDAIKIDLKGFSEDFYRNVSNAHLQPVLRSIKQIRKSNTHLEIVNLVVPTLNDRLDQLRALARWLAQEISPDIPLHFSRFSPLYKLTNLPPTPVETLDEAQQTAQEEGLRFVYVGNVAGHPGNHTHCPACGRIIIAREGCSVTEYHLTGGQCAYCGAAIPGVWWSQERSGAPVVVEPAPPAP
jgi:pyruvate formate lyase activating enzyme